MEINYWFLTDKDWGLEQLDELGYLDQEVDIDFQLGAIGNIIRWIVKSLTNLL